MAAVETGAPRGHQKAAKKKPKRIGIKIDMTPMVDIAFLLLIFFMVTTVFRAPQTIEINIPPSKTKVEIAESNVLTLRMLEDGRMYWSIGKATPQLIEMAGIQKLLIEKNKLNERLVTLVKIDRKSPYSQMVDILDEMYLGNIQRFSVTVLEDKEKREVFGS
ncbi:MAG: biopolymer transporter ExbD [Candidatus Latescibacteria bacterium]|nr:biopolymer transporter ExbD [Candidatus Latescibacterota bacterium]